MSTFHPEKLFVEYMDGANTLEPAIGRRYTLTHSDGTGDLFLNIGRYYAWEKVNPLRDEVLAEWKTHKNSLYFYVYLYIDQGEYSPPVSAKRYEIFKKELPLAITAIKYGDRFFFHAYPHLNNAPIIIHYMSAYPQFAGVENWGTFQSHRI